MKTNRVFVDGCTLEFLEKNIDWIRKLGPIKLAEFAIRIAQEETETDFDEMKKSLALLGAILISGELVRRATS